MEKKTECEIVQDLLLGYVDETLNKESKKLVEKHLIECENCSERLKKVLQCYSVYDSIITEKKHSLRGTCRKEF